MRKATLGLFAAMSVSVFAIGCDQNEATPTQSAADAANAAAAKAEGAAASAEDAAKKATDAAAEVKDKAVDAAAEVKDKAADAAADVKEKASEVAAGLTEQAQKLFDDAKAAITKGDFDGATKYVDQLKGLQDKLPADWKAKVDEVVKMLADAKAKLGNIPGMN